MKRSTLFILLAAVAIMLVMCYSSREGFITPATYSTCYCNQGRDIVVKGKKLGWLKIEKMEGRYYIHINIVLPKIYGSYNVSLLNQNTGEEYYIGRLIDHTTCYRIHTELLGNYDKYDAFKIVGDDPSQVYVF